MFNATLVKRQEITTELLVIGVKPDVAIPDFLPGQYLALGLPGSAARPSGFPPEKEVAAADKIIKRAYSIGSSPNQKEMLELYIAIVPDGALTSRLVMLKPGDRLFAAPKITGTFTLEGVPAEANLVFVATGTGIAPFISMLRTESTWTPGRHITLLHGVRYPADLAYREEVELLASQRSNFSYFPVVSRAEQATGRWEGRRGHVQTLFTTGEINLKTGIDHVFLCGNPAMIDQVEKSLTERGYKEHSRKVPGDLHLERYW